MRAFNFIFVAAALSGIVASLLAWGFASDAQRHQFLSMCWLRSCDDSGARGTVERHDLQGGSNTSETREYAGPERPSMLHTTSASSSSGQSALIADGSHWSHNGSLMYLRVDGSSRRIYYLQPRAGMSNAGARPDSLLFDGADDNGRWSGSARIFNKRCGKQYPYLVEGGPRDGDAIIELMGRAPRVGPDCDVVGYGGSNDDLIFSFVRQ